MKFILRSGSFNFFLRFNPKLLLLHEIESVNILGNFSLDSHYLAQVVVCQAKEHYQAVKDYPVEIKWVVVDGFSFYKVFNDVPKKDAIDEDFNRA